MVNDLTGDPIKAVRLSDGRYVTEKLAKEIEESVIDDLGEAAKEYSKKVSDGHNYRDLRVGFIAGAEWQAEQMMKEAVEGTIDDCGTPARLRLEMPGGSFRIGDRVRIWDKVSVIVLPKEGEK